METSVTSPPSTTTPFNNGAPLTQDQIQKIRTQSGINTNPATASITSMTVQQRLASLSAGTFASNTPVNTGEEPTLAGGLIRGAIRPIARSLLSLNDAGNQIRSDVTEEPAKEGAEQTPLTKYLEQGTGENLQRIGAGFDPAQGFTPQNMKAIQDAVQNGVDVAGMFAGGGAAGDAVEGGLNKLGQSALHGAKVGGLLGATGGAATVLDPDTSVGQAVGNTIKGGLGGAATSAIAEPALGALGDKLGLSKERPEVSASQPSSPEELNQQAVTANKIINPDNVVRQSDIEKMSDVNAAGESNSTSTSKNPLTRKTVLKPEVMAADPHNQMVRELMDKGTVSPDNTQIHNISGVKGEIKNEGGNLSRFLSDPHNDIPVTHADLEKNLNQAYEDFKKENDIEDGSSEDKKAQATRDTFLNEIRKEYAKQPLDEEKGPGTASATKRGIENFNSKMEAKLGEGIYKDTPEGRTQVKMAQLARKSGYDTIQESLNNFDSESVKSNAFGKDAKALAERAKTFNSRQGFIDQMMKEGSNTQAETAMHAREGTANAGTAKSDVSEAGINVNPRATNAGGTHGAGYSTTPEEDLGEIYDMAHEGINSTKGDAFKASLQRQAKLYALRDEMMSRTGVNTPQSTISKMMNSPRGYAFRRIARVLGPMAGMAFGATELANR